MTPEKIVQNQVLDYLRDLEKQGLPVMSDRRQAGGFSYKMGQADVWASINGRHIEIECKRPSGGEQAAMQMKWEMKCKKANVMYILANNLNSVKEVVEKLLNL